ncbi:MAG: murein biosynthesis integral membrane protein MurJ [Bacillota bacterium]|jgi:putative peptidoglycan lipid II flippase
MSKSLFKATGIILAINLIVKLLGFIRETSIAWGFGATAITDAYKVAYTIPYFLQAILGFALVTVTVPVLTRYWINNDQEAAFHVGSSITNIIAIIMAVVSVIGIAFAPTLVFLTAPNLAPETSVLAIEMTRIMFPSVLFMSLGMVFTGILNSRYRFAAGALAPGISNIVIICSVLLFSTSGILSLAWGTLISFAAFFTFLLIAVKRAGFRYQPKLDLQHSAVKGVLKDIMPIVLGVAVNQIYALINRIFASGLADGSISALDFANKLMNLPIGVFVAAVAAAIYPALAERALKKDNIGLAKTMNKGLGMVLLVAIPASIGLIVLSQPIVQLLFERGAFDAAATSTTAYALSFYCVGLVAVAANMILTRAYYSFNDVKTPVFMGMISIGVNVAASFILLPIFQHGGLALANSIAAFVNTVLLYTFLRRRLSEISTTRLFKSAGKVLISSLLMGVIVMLIMRLTSGFATSTFNLLVCVGGSIIIGCIVYFLLVKLLRVEEVESFIGILREKLQRKKLNN